MLTLRLFYQNQMIFKLLDVLSALDLCQHGWRGARHRTENA